jgi:predicted NAD/FAD-binding protein
MAELIQNKNRSSVAIIGSGISGLSAAYFLSDKYQIKLYEKDDRLGGHSNTVIVDYENHKIPVDTGFIVFNHQTYPNLKKFFELLKVDCQKSNMSFAVKVDNGRFEYAGTSLATVFAQLKNALNPKFWGMLRDILKFNKKAQDALNQNFDPNYTLEKFLFDLGVGEYFREFYLLPMSGAIWSCPLETMLNYPAQSFVRFFKNHGLLTLSNQPQWFTVEGGSIEYVKKISQKIEDKISLCDQVNSVERCENGKVLVKSKKGEELFDHVLFALHGDQVLKILKNPTKQESEVFASFKYQKNLAILHCDESLMPKSKKAWASWVYEKNSTSKEGQIAVTYWMNNLQNISSKFPLFVTLNPTSEIDETKIFGKFDYEHPVFDSDAVKAQSQISALQGFDRLYFCGAYQKYGFHEDGISSSIAAINKLGVFAPWQS